MLAMVDQVTTQVHLYCQTDPAARNSLMSSWPICLTVFANVPVSVLVGSRCLSFFDMASASHLRERRASLSPPIDAMSTAPDHNVPDSEEGDLPQSSQSSRIVSVPRNAAQAGASLAIAKIEAIFESMVDVLTGGNDTLSIPYRNRNTPQRPLGTLKFPGRNMTEATKFSPHL